MSITGARYIIEFLKRQGVRVVAGIPGGSILPIYDALAETKGIRHVLARHEQGAAFMAQGMARLSGRPGVCFATSGPGATNLVTAIADARRDGVPIVCITGQVPLPMIGTDAFQEVDIVAITASITKLSRRVDSAAELPEALAQAFAVAASGRPGPVLLDIPKDVQCQPVPAQDMPAQQDERLPAASGWDISRAAAMINAAKRPVLLLGGGAVRAGAQALRLAVKAAIPATSTLMGLGAIPAGHPLDLGMHGMHGHPCANIALHECDLLLAVGNRFDDRATGDPATFCPEARIIHVNMDASELGRIKPADLGVAADAGQFLEALADLVEPRERRGWMARIRGLKQHAPHLEHDAERTHARAVIAAVAGRMDEDAVVVTDVGQHQMFVAQSFPFKTPGRWLTSGGLGVMGFGLPAAIGAALADPDAQVVCFSGDGSLKMNIQELCTLAETGANVKIVVLDNQSLGLVAQQQRLFYNRRSASRYASGTDFSALARAFGVRGIDLDAQADPEAALDDALASHGPCLIHVRVDPAAMVFPMVPPGAANTQMLHSHGPKAQAMPTERDMPEAVNMA